jgi:hypothetical protein
VALDSGIISWLVTKRRTDREYSETQDQVSQMRGVLSDLAKERMVRYQELWEITEKASASRAEELTYQERMKMRSELEKWYFKGGGGMLLSKGTKDLLDKAKRLLEVPGDDAESSRKAISAVSELGGQVIEDLGVRD